MLDFADDEHGARRTIFSAVLPIIRCLRPE
jgi:hypothetical protein